MTILSTPYRLNCRMGYERPGDDRIPVVGFKPNIWLDGIGEQFLIGRIDGVAGVAEETSQPFELTMTVIGVEELNAAPKKGAAVRLFRGGWEAPWLAGELVALTKIG